MNDTPQTPQVTTQTPQEIRWQEELVKIQDQINAKQKLHSFYISHKAKFLSLPPLGYTYGPIDFDNLSHNDIVKVMLAFPGKWTKTINNLRIDYRLQVEDNITIRCYSGEPPPSCQIVEKEVEVPETYVPAHTEKRKVLKCTGDLADA